MSEEANMTPSVPKHGNAEDMIEKKSNKGKIAAIIGGSIVGLLAIVYVAGGLFFGSHFFPNTAYGDTDISFKSQEELVTTIDDQVANYSVKISGRDFEMELTKEDIPVKVDSAAVAAEAIGGQNGWAWPAELFNEHDLSGIVNATFDTDAVNKLITEQVDAFNKDATPSEPAKIEYVEPEPPAKSSEAEAAEGEEAEDEEAAGESAEATAEETDGKGSFEIVDEVYGTTIDTDLLLAKADAEIAGLATTIEVTEQEVEQPTLKADDPRLPEALITANGYIAGDIPLTLDGDVEAGEIPATTIATWVVLDDEAKAVLDEDAVLEFAEEKAEELNTVGTERTYTRPDGEECTVEGGTYGWKIDEEAFEEALIEDVESGKNETIDIPCSQTAAKYEGPGKADWGKYVDVDLGEQMVRYYDADGELLRDCKCVSGKNSSPTPTGAFYLRNKESPSTLISYNPDGSEKYKTKVKYWMPFDRNVVGLHDAWWRSSFGGDIHEYSGSHGCVNISTENAEWFYGELKVGTPIIVHD